MAPKWLFSKVLKNGGECNDKGLLALELLDRSTRDTFIAGTTIRIRWETSNTIGYGVVQSIEKNKILLAKADGFPCSMWFDALKSLSNNTIVRVQEIPIWEGALLQVFYTQDKNDDDDKSDDGINAINDLLNPASNNNFASFFSPSDNPEQIVDSINNAIVDGNINSNDLGVDFEAAGYNVDGIFLNTGDTWIALDSKVTIQQSCDDIFFVASIPVNNDGFGFTYTNHHPFNVIQGKANESLSILYNGLKIKKKRFSMCVEDKAGNKVFHKEICDMRAITINGRRIYQCIGWKDAVDKSMIGSYTNANVTFGVKDWGWDFAGNNTPIDWVVNRQKGWSSPNEKIWINATISQKDDKIITLDAFHKNDFFSLKKNQPIAVYIHISSNPLYCIVESIFSNATGSTLVIAPANGYSEDERKQLLQSINVNQKCLVYLHTQPTNGIDVSYRPSKVCNFSSEIPGITNPQVLGNVLNNCVTPFKARSFNISYSTFSFQSKIIGYGPARIVAVGYSLTIPDNNGRVVKMLNASPGEKNFAPTEEVALTVATKCLGELFVDLQSSERLRQRLIEKLREKLRRIQEQESSMAATVDQIIDEIKEMFPGDVLSKPIAVNTSIQIADLKNGKLITQGSLVNLRATRDKNCNKTWQFDVECDSAMKIYPPFSLTFVVTSELMTVNQFLISNSEK
jgi:hypothetical protein